MTSKELIPFLMIGYPTLELSEKIASNLLSLGVRTMELGVPFSDPMADGPVIQHAAEVALAEGVNLQKCLDVVSRLSANYPQARLIIFSYLNPILSFGLSRYVQVAKQVGVAATLTVDLPIEEAGAYIHCHQKVDLGTVFLASPTTSFTRFKSIADFSTEFVYYVSRTGVTGEKATLSETLYSEINNLRILTRKKIAVGFGVSTCEQVAEVGQIADYVVVGSRILSLISENPENPVLAVGNFIEDCLKVLGKTQ